LEYAIKTAFDICAIINRDLRFGVPEDDEEIIENLCSKGIINQNFSETRKNEEISKYSCPSQWEDR